MIFWGISTHNPIVWSHQGLLVEKRKRVWYNIDWLANRQLTLTANANWVVNRKPEMKLKVCFLTIQLPDGLPCTKLSHSSSSRQPSVTLNSSYGWKSTLARLSCSSRKLAKAAAGDSEQGSAPELDEMWHHLYVSCQAQYHLLTIQCKHTHTHTLAVRSHHFELW